MDDDEIGKRTQSNLKIMNPVSETKLILAGNYAGLKPGMSVLDIGCGNGTLLNLWHKEFGVSGTGIELQKESASRARNLLQGTGITVIEGDAAAYIPDESFDVVSVFGTAFIFGGAEAALQHLAGHVKEGGCLVIGDRVWKKTMVPPEFAREWPEVPTAFELTSTARELGFTLTGMISASSDDWDRYESAVWQNAASENMDEYLRHIQDEYLAYGREFMDWSCFVFQG
ncbi:Methyltransferase type 11 [Methanocorpusculum labreanum Z]|uniref:Methyltransferase type 11 n=1 Tax=Methanocorpusculum labreanum (strain ATCC 43576 / DSM 4855 / Z) TaxID=410358 RepID=A2SU69_METLZ|nr:class I SAM-dependent methyltransferase [Methanocorpusculum labreanum]ABN07875.1 Methyltransferase type 11 [Methanocorpusculum labreanum Z]